MLKNYKSIFFVLLTSSSLLLGCEDAKDGDPGLKGETGDAGTKGEQGEASAGLFTIQGFIEGTITGKYANGSNLNETFKFEYALSEPNMIYKNGNEKYIDLERYGKDNNFLKLSEYYLEDEDDKSKVSLDYNGQDNFFGIYLESDGGEFSVDQSYPMNFIFTKHLTNSSVQRIAAQAYMKETESFVREISLEENKTYQFNSYQNGDIYVQYYPNYYEEVYAYYVYSYYDGGVEVYYDPNTGVLQGVLPYKSGTYQNSGEVFDLFNKITYSYDEGTDQHIFLDATTNVSLSEFVPVIPADVATITNYKHDSATGVITFDYSMKISAYRNSTQNDLTLTGKFNSGSKVYTDVVFRTRN